MFWVVIFVVDFFWVFDICWCLRYVGFKFVWYGLRYVEE